MKPILIIAAMISAATSIGAAPMPPTPPTRPAGRPMPSGPACGAASGAIELEIDDRLGGNADPTRYELTTSSTKLYATGAWTYTEQRAGKPTRSASGCLTETQRKTVHDDLARASWTTHTEKIDCHARSLNETAYGSGGKTLYVSQTCGSETLDDASAAVRVELAAIMDAAVNPKPPCCKP